MVKTRKSRDDIRTALRVLLQGYMDFAGTDRSCAVRDLLTELMHLCDFHRLDFAGRIRLARQVYREEVAAGHSLGEKR
jgi:hypothetical protein